MNTYDITEDIVQFNREAGLLGNGYDDFLESSFQIEEALEGFEQLDVLAADLKLTVEATPKNLSREILGHVYTPGIPDVDRLDKACDAVVFAVGSMAKLGLTAEQIVEAIGIVTDANSAKLLMPKDEYGKLSKPSDFIGPEVKLQTLLDSR